MSFHGEENDHPQKYVDLLMFEVPQKHAEIVQVLQLL